MVEARRRQLSSAQRLQLRVVIAVAQGADSEALSQLVAPVGAPPSSALSAALGAPATPTPTAPSMPGGLTHSTVLEAAS